MRLILIVAFIVSSIPVSMAQTVGDETGLAIPRFISLRGDIVYARTGPGTRYPIKWVYERKNLPVEVVQEYDTWRKIRDIDGEEGWVHQSLLSGNRYAIITGGQTVPMVKQPADNSNAVALVESNAQISINECQSNWCKVEASGFKGFIHSDHIWGVYEGERIQ